MCVVGAPREQILRIGMALDNAELSAQDEPPGSLQIQESAGCWSDALRWNAL